jgi:hypothetical protein
LWSRTSVFSFGNLPIQSPGLTNKQTKGHPLKQVRRLFEDFLRRDKGKKSRT